MRVILCKKKYI